jgi:hypothetical protein
LSPSAQATRQAEAALGLKRTKFGSGDKEHGYLMAAAPAKKMGAVLLVSAFLLLMLFFSMNASQQQAKRARIALATQTVKMKSALVEDHIQTMHEGQQQESKLVKFITLLQSNFASDKVHEQAMEDFQLSLGAELKKHKNQLKVQLKSLGGNKKVKDYLAKVSRSRLWLFTYHVLF